jgi:septal ring factor EnvC (AmiA/AmiB activator)
LVLKLFFLFLYAIGFREKRRYFPDTIYYTGTPQQVRDYNKKITQRMEGVSSAETTITPDAVATASVSVVAPIVSDKVNESWKVDDKLETKVVLLVEAELRKQLDSEIMRYERKIDDLEHRLKDQQQMLLDQQHMLKDQQQMLAQILGKLER